MTGLHPEQVMYANLQDAEYEAEGLDPTKPNRGKEAAAGRAEQHCHELAEHFLARGARWRLRLAEYRETATEGE